MVQSGETYQMCKQTFAGCRMIAKSITDGAMIDGTRISCGSLSRYTESDAMRWQAPSMLPYAKLAGLERAVDPETVEKKYPKGTEVRFFVVLAALGILGALAVAW